MLRPTVSRPVCPGIKHPSAAYDQILIIVWQLLVSWYGAFCLTKGRVCRLHLLLDLASGVNLRSEFLGIRYHTCILLSQIRDFPFRRLLRLAGSRWRYSTPPPQGKFQLNCIIFKITLQHGLRKKHSLYGCTHSMHLKIKHNVYTYMFCTVFRLLSIFFKTKMCRLTRSPCCVSVYFPFQLLNAWTNPYVTCIQRSGWLDMTHTSHKVIEQSTVEVSITLYGVTLTDSLIRWSQNEWPSVCREIPFSADKMFWTSNKHAKWTSYIWWQLSPSQQCTS
jgi:hypothetical protein